MKIRLLTGALASLAIAPTLHAQGVASDRLIDSITVTGARERATVEVQLRVRALHEVADARGQGATS